MRSGDRSPVVSWVLGPRGTDGASGSAPRPGGTIPQSTAEPPGIHSRPSVTVFRFASSRRGLTPGSTDAPHSSRPSSVTTVQEVP